MDPQIIVNALSPAQLDRLRAATKGKRAPLDLLALDPPLVRSDGSRTSFGDQVVAIA